MEVLTSKNRMSEVQPRSIHFTLMKMLSLDYYANHEGPAKISASEDYFITYCCFLDIDSTFHASVMA